MLKYDFVWYRYTANRQPGKALPYYLRLRRPNVFELIRENNLFTDVQDQILLLVEFDHELMEKRRKEKDSKENKEKPSTGSKVDQQRKDSEAIKLLVDNIHSIPVCCLSTSWVSALILIPLQISRVVQQLQKRPDYLFLYLDALVEKDPHLVSGFADLQVRVGVYDLFDCRDLYSFSGQDVRGVCNVEADRLLASKQLL
jgi:hypothetical protein